MVVPAPAVVLLVVRGRADDNGERLDSMLARRTPYRCADRSRRGTAVVDEVLAELGADDATVAGPRSGREPAQVREPGLQVALPGADVDRRAESTRRPARSTGCAARLPRRWCARWPAARCSAGQVATGGSGPYPSLDRDDLEGRRHVAATLHPSRRPRDDQRSTRRPDRRRRRRRGPCGGRTCGCGDGACPAGGRARAQWSRCGVPPPGATAPVHFGPGRRGIAASPLTRSAGSRRRPGPCPARQQGRGALRRDAWQHLAGGQAGPVASAP